MSLLLDALYKASKDKEKVVELSLEPRPPEVTEAPVNTTIQQPEEIAVEDIPLELPRFTAQKPFELETFSTQNEPSESSQPAAEKIVLENPFPSLELTLEPRAEDVQPAALVEEISHYAEVILDKVTPIASEPTNTYAPADADVISGADQTAEQAVFSAQHSTPVQEEVAPATAKENFTHQESQVEAVLTSTRQEKTPVHAIKQPGKIAQILSKSKSRSVAPNDSDAAKKKRLVFLSATAFLILLAFGGLFLYQAIQTDSTLPNPVAPPVMVHDQSQDVQTPVLPPVAEVVAPSDLPLKAVLDTANSIKDTNSATTGSTETTAISPPQRSGSKQGIVVATTKPNYLSAGYAALVDGRLEEAKQSYEKVLLNNAQESNALLGLAYIAHQRGQREEALEYYQRVLRQDPTNTVAASGVLALDTRIDPNASRLKAQDLAERQPDSVSALTTAANAMVRDGMLAEALPLFARAKKLEPENPLHVYNYGVALDRMGQVEKAIEQYKQVIQLSEKQLPQGVRPFSLETVRTRLNELQNSTQVTSENL